MLVLCHWAGYFPSRGHWFTSEVGMAVCVSEAEMSLPIALYSRVPWNHFWLPDRPVRFSGPSRGEVATCWPSRA